MKKLMALLMALCMGCMLIPAMAEGNSPVGSWYLFSAETQGMTLSVDGIGLSMVITLNEDGTCTLEESAMGQTQNAAGTWAATDNGVAVTIQGDTAEFTIADGVMSFSPDGGETILHLNQEAPTGTRSGAAAEKIAEAVTEFDGEWVITKVSMMGVEMTVEEAGIDNMAVMKIENGKITEVAVDGTENVMEPEFVDGKLVVTTQQDGVDIVMNFVLLEDGNLQALLTADYQGFTMDLQIMYAPAAAAAEEPAA